MSVAAKAAALAGATGGVGRYSGPFPWLELGIILGGLVLLILTHELVCWLTRPKPDPRIAEAARLNEEITRHSIEAHRALFIATTPKD